MIGVVVWSNAAAEKAVIWCEDHAALAYMQGRQDYPVMASWPEAGDLLELDSEMIGNIRHARNVCMITESHCPEISGLLLGAHTGEPALRLVSEDGHRVHRRSPASARTSASHPASKPGLDASQPICVNGRN